MLNIIWLSMIFLAMICGIATNRLDQVVLAVTDSAKNAFNFYFIETIRTTIQYNTIYVLLASTASTASTTLFVALIPAAAFFAAKAARAATNLDISGFLHEFCAF